MNYNFSFWEQESFLKDIDVAIIGSGIVGLSAAIHLKSQHPNMNVTIIERGAIPIGASTRNAGFACIGSMTELIDDLESRTEEEVFHLVKKRYEGLALLRNMLSDKAIGYAPCGGYEVFNKKDITAYEKCQSMMSYFNDRLKSITGIKDTFAVSSLSSDMGLNDVEHMILNRAEGSIDTGEMMQNLLLLAKNKGVRFLNGLDIKTTQSINNQILMTTKCNKEIHSKNLIIANNGFAQSLMPDLKVTPARNQVLVTSRIKNLKLNGTFHAEKGYVYFRNIKDRVLIGGYRHLDPIGESTSDFGFSSSIQSALTSLLDSTIIADGSYTIDYKWSGIMGVGDSKLPIIAEVFPNCVAAVRLGGMGIAIGSMVGRDAADKLL